MDRDIFERNLLALSSQDKDLCTRLTRARTDGAHYTFIPARNGQVVPALRDESGHAHPLQSIMDPEREARRLIGTVQGPLYLVIFGLAGGDLVTAALERRDIHGILIVEFGLDSVAELLASRAYQGILGCKRVCLMVDPGEEEIKNALAARYQPAFCGGISVLPVRQRTLADQERYNRAGEAVRSAISAISRDYSVQAHFGRRWFSNTLRNLLVADRAVPPLPRCREAIIAAAGPSLEEGYQAMKNRSPSCFLLASDTALQHLLARGILPDGVISIDCQHISYQHSIEALPPSTRLFLDLASPRLLASRTAQPFFLASAHPLSRYVAKYWRSFPPVDSSGGNVTHAAVSLALELGARDIRIFGADYGYPRGEAYARGTYIHRLFSLSQSRLSPLSARFFDFVHRDAKAHMEHNADTWRIATDTLDAYRSALVTGFSTAPAKIRLGEGLVFGGSREETNTGDGDRNGRTISFTQEHRAPLTLAGPGPARMDKRRFLEDYRQALAALPRPEAGFAEYLAGLDDRAREVLYTILPLAAWLRRTQAKADEDTLFDRVRELAVNEITRIMAIPESTCL